MCLPFGKITADGEVFNHTHRVVRISERIYLDVDSECGYKSLETYNMVVTVAWSHETKDRKTLMDFFKPKYGSFVSVCLADIVEKLSIDQENYMIARGIDAEREWSKILTSRDLFIRNIVSDAIKIDLMGPLDSKCVRMEFGDRRFVFRTEPGLKMARAICRDHSRILETERAKEFMSGTYQPDLYRDYLKRSKSDA